MDKFYRERRKIIGGPGCGKTHKLLEKLKGQFDNGLTPDQVLLVGFAKATVDHLKKLCEKKFNYSSMQTDSIQTIHAYCYNAIGGDGYEVLQRSHKKEFKKKLNTDPNNWIKINTAEYDDEEQKEDFAVWGETEDHKVGLILQLVGLARHNRTTDLNGLIKYYDSCRNHGYDKLQRDEIEYVYTQYTNYKNKNGIIDFEDMLHKALSTEVVFDTYKVLIVDECQDLSRLEWKVVAKLSKNSEELYLAGDDDQAIYGWKGSDVRIFQKWPCRKREYLPQTHRLPVKIYDLAQRVVSNIETRLGNKYECKKSEEGVLESIGSLEEIDNKIKVGANMIMSARSWGKCEQFVRYLKDKGLVWQQKSTALEGRRFLSSISDSVKGTITNWHKLQKGEGLKGPVGSRLIKPLKENLVKFGKKTALTNTNRWPEAFKNPDNLFTFKDLKEKYYVLADINKEWFDVFDFRTERVVSHKKPKALYTDQADYNNYLKTAYQLDPTFEKTDILVSTIHGVKGMERNIVVMSTVWTWPSYKNFKQGTPLEQDEEVRVSYVGITRAKHELYLFEPAIKKSENYFPLLNI